MSDLPDMPATPATPATREVQSSEVASLKRLAVFENLPDTATAKVALLAKSVTLAKGEELAVPEDPDAPFFKAADYGIVGDAFDVVPKLTEAIKTAG